MQKDKKVILVTGAAGFIGYHLCSKLISPKNTIIGFDNLNNYYDIKLKKNRIKNIETLSKKYKNSWHFIKGNLEKKALIERVFRKFNPQIVVNLAAQAGVRYSLTNPISYINSNILGFTNILECCRGHEIKNLIYASSSSVYGGNINSTFNENDNTDKPLSLYAATKKSNELMAHAYSNLYKIPSIGLRFFTVYGPWGRPDMAPFIFTKSIFEGKPIQIFNNGNVSRDFTYIDDVIEVISRLLDKPAAGNTNFESSKTALSDSLALHRIFNIGNSRKINLMEFIKILEDEIGKKAKKEFLGMQAGDIKSTLANTSAIEEWTGFKPNTSLAIGIKKFVSWYKSYYL